MSGAYYSEHDPKAAAWLRELIKQGHIAPGVVDERSIEDIKPDELRGYTQVHFFAGVGVWSYALRRAGWPDDRPVWTGSCPCQPFSAAGKGAGFADERHLWPAWFHLITTAKRRGVPVFGEQVASKDGYAWLDLVQTDLEGMGYTCWPVVLPAAGIGAPHERHRTFFVGNPLGEGLEGLAGHGDRKTGRTVESGPTTETGGDGGLADAVPAGRAEGRPGTGIGPVAGGGESSGLADSESARGRRRKSLQNGADNQYGGSDPLELDGRPRPADAWPGPTNGLWADADWLYCRDGKWRPVEPGTFPLAHGAAARVGRLRGYDNAINAEVATTFIEAYMQVEHGFDLV